MFCRKIEILKLVLIYGIAACLYANCVVADSRAAEAPSTRPTATWIDPAPVSGGIQFCPVSQTDYRQLLFELQQEWSDARATNQLDVLFLQPYTLFASPRNNLGNCVPLSLLHWNRTVSVAVPHAEGRASLSVLSTDGEVDVLKTNVALFAVSPVRSVTYRGSSVELRLSSEDFFEEAPISNRVVDLFVDADDGKGWRVFQPDEAVRVSYDTRGSKTLSFAAVLADGQLLYSAAPLEVAALITPDPTTTIALTTSYGLTGAVSNIQGSLYVLKSPQFAGVLPQTQTFAKASSRAFSGTGYTTYNAQLKNPVLVVEGFDMNNSMDWDVLYNTLNSESLVSLLGQYGRDLLVLDFADATRDIFENAAVCALAIEYVNKNRATFDDKFTVIGASMGGLVTRTALRKIDDFPSAFLLAQQSRANTWISFDSPHTGANIPLGIQKFCAFFGDVATETKGGLFYDSIYQGLVGPLEYKQKLATPAARQMLVASYLTSDIPSGSYLAFYKAMSDIGYPLTAKRVAICNGSGTNVRHPFSPGQLIVNWFYRNYLEVDIDAQIYALYKSPATSSTVFYGRLNPFDIWFNTYDWISTSSARYDYAIDNASGGTRSSFSELYSQIPASFRQSGSYCSYGAHCFIPTVSALGMPMSLCEYKADDYTNSYSPFNEMHTAVTNEAHITITAANKDWFVKAILENVDTDNDGMDDWTEYQRGLPYNLATFGVGAPVHVTAFNFAPGGGGVLEWAFPTNGAPGVIVYGRVSLTEGGWEPITNPNSLKFPTASASGLNVQFPVGKYHFFKILAP